MFRNLMMEAAVSFDMSVHYVIMEASGSLEMSVQ